MHLICVSRCWNVQPKHLITSFTRLVAMHFKTDQKWWISFPQNQYSAIYLFQVFVDIAVINVTLTQSGVFGQKKTFLQTLSMMNFLRKSTKSFRINMYVLLKLEPWTSQKGPHFEWISDKSVWESESRRLKWSDIYEKWGRFVFAMSVCPFVSNFNIGHIFLASSDSNLIFGMHVYLIKQHILRVKMLWSRSSFKVKGKKYRSNRPL